MLSLTLKYLHILSAVLLSGTGLISAFYTWRAIQSARLEIMLSAAETAMICYWIFMAPAAIILAITGFWLIERMHYPIHDTWIMGSIILYGLVVACEAGIALLQHKMLHLLKNAEKTGRPVGALFYTYAKMWFVPGWPVLVALLASFYLMIVKPN